jgi:drug/metabolite transporter (DMT)-like permease
VIKDDGIAMNKGVMQALGAAVLFGASTPLAKLLVGQISPLLLAGLLYLGSGIGLLIIRSVRDSGWRSPNLSRHEWPWLIGAIVMGGMLGPAALMFGLVHTGGAAASLFLNLEAVLTAVLAWLVFRESTDRRIIFGMLLIVAGGVVLSWPTTQTQSAHWLGPAAIAVACLCWAIDNNLTRAVATADALFIAGSKGLVAGLANCGLALSLNAVWPAPSLAAAAMVVGLLGYGASLVLFVLALRALGTARTGAYFSVAPFAGAALAIALGESPSWLFWLAALCMGSGVWLHVSERHTHEHAHQTLDHTHAHVHDEHHQHSHDFAWDGAEPHVHPHRHVPLRHAHPHFPDAHHRHSHG